MEAIQGLLAGIDFDAIMNTIVDYIVQIDFDAILAKIVEFVMGFIQL